VDNEKNMKWSIFVALVASFVGSLAAVSNAMADIAVVPSTASATEGNNNSVVPFHTGARTNQYQMTNAAMGGLAVGSVITGVQFRLDGGGASSPAAAITWADYEITIAKAANAIGSMSTTLASNMVSPVLVMDGSFTLAAASFSGTGSPRDFGAVVLFDTGYTYTGGDLVMLLTHTDGTPGSFPTVDAIQTDAAGTGGIRALATPTAFQAASADNTAFRMPVMQFVYTTAAVPEASSWLLMGVVAVGACVVQYLRRLRASEKVAA
jgi:hypothetical protein